MPLDDRRQRMERLRIHRLVVVADGDETLPIGVLSMTDLVHAIAVERRAAAAATDARCLTTAHQGRGRAEGDPRVRLAAAPAVLDVEAYVEDFGRSVVPAYRRGVADASCPPTPAWPAASSRPGPRRRATSAASRRASPSSSSMRASAAWPASAPARTRAILGMRRAGARARGRDRGVRGDAAGAGRRGRRRPARTSPRPRSTARSRRKRARTAALRDLRGSRPLQGLRRVRRGLRRARPRRARS